MREAKAPGPYKHLPRPYVFLAGSTEIMAAEDWQKRLVHDMGEVDVTWLNPRRDDWDASWVQSIDNPQFNEQVTWELDALEDADIIALYLAPGTRPPISLLELGLFHKRNIIVCCPQGFWRKGNVEMACQRYAIKLRDTYENFARAIDRELWLYHKKCPAS